MKVILEPAFILHAKFYGETSLMLDVFTLNHGLIAVLAKSARGIRSRFKGCLIPFAPLTISCSGKTELLHMNIAEPHEASYFFQGQNLFNAIYLNELLIKLLPRFDPYPELFTQYKNALQQLIHSDQPQKILRVFEKQLLSALGFGLQLDRQANGQTILADQFYHYHLEQGLIHCKKGKDELSFQGSHLLAIEKNEFETNEILKDAKRLMRLVLKNLLGRRELKTRELYRPLSHKVGEGWGEGINEFN